MYSYLTKSTLWPCYTMKAHFKYGMQILLGQLSFNPVQVNKTPQGGGGAFGCVAQGLWYSQTVTHSSKFLWLLNLYPISNINCVNYSVLSEFILFRLRYTNGRGFTSREIAVLRDDLCERCYHNDHNKPQIVACHLQQKTCGWPQKKSLVASIFCQPVEPTIKYNYISTNYLKI